MSVLGLRLVFDPALDRSGWPGVLDGRAAAAGEAWYGRMGLLARLETELGLGGRHPTALERATALVAALATMTDWWRASYEADPLGTCVRLLHDRDLLAMWGWRGEPASDRLATLWSATRSAAPGLPDRLQAVEQALARRRPDLASIELATAPESLEPAWTRVFAALAAAGVSLSTRASPPAVAGGDLAAARTGGFMPKGDGSLVLLRPHGPLAAADEVAAYLVARSRAGGAAERVLIVGGDDVLDAALGRHGLPRTGAATAAPASTALLRLVLEAAFEPMEPADLHALLCLDPGPFPRRVAGALVGALRGFPSRRAPEWGAALARGLARCDEAWRPDVERRVAALLMPAVGREQPLATAELHRRLAVLGDWANRRLHTTPSLHALVRLLDDAGALIGDDGARGLVALRRLCDELEAGAGHDVPAEVGLAAVVEPGAVLGPADTVVWWSFTRDSAPAPTRLRLSRAERLGLARLGVTPPELGKLMVGEAARWRRPLEQATRQLLLVCPATSATGEPAFPHPLWDELRSVMAPGADPSRLERTGLPSPRRGVAPRPLPRPALTITTRAPLALRERESPSSVERLLGCSLSWALTYPGRLHGGLAAGPGTPSPLLYGTLAHRLLAAILTADVRDADTAAARAREVVDRDLGSLCESLALPRYQVERTAVKQTIVRAATELGRLLALTGATVRGTEHPTTGTVDGIGLRGTADLILDAPAVIIDLKWGATTYRDKLATGTAIQLAAYAAMQDVPHEVAYFALHSQELLAPAGSALPGATLVGTATAADTWAGVTTAFAARRAELAAGALVAPAADLAPGTKLESRLTAGRLALAPGCRYCDYQTLCGLRRCT